jgi:crotonobetainyl-CoA:carnitine CoA-transferase CaiB-like acyl-CoA transferase
MYQGDSAPPRGSVGSSMAPYPDRPRALDGIRVVDFGRVVAAPHAARWMADLGAEVIKVERPVYGDDTRLDPYIYEPGLSGAFMQQNWGKKSLSIDLRHEQAKPVIEALLSWADVVFENFRPGVMDRLGFGWDVAHGLNRGLVMCSISAYGQTGPYASRPGYGPLAEAIAGISDMSGEPDGPPMPTVVPIADNLAAAIAFGSVCAALLYRQQSGEGQYVDISLLDAAFQMHDIAAQQYLATNGAVEMRRRGLRDVTWVPWGFFKGTDGWICIMCGNESIWPPLARAMGRPDMVDDPRFDSFEHRYENRQYVYQVVEEWVSSFDTIRDIVDLLCSLGVPCAPVNSIGQAVRDPQLRARDMLVSMSHPRLGAMEVVNSGLNFSGTAAGIQGLPPYLGEHNHEIVVTSLGMSEKDYQSLVASGVLYRDDRIDE